MSNDKDIVDRLDFIELSSCYECGGNNTEYRLIQKAIKEIKSLRLEVERLRLRPEELDALSWCRDVLPRMWEPCAVVQIHSEFCGKMLKRLGGGE